MRALRFFIPLAIFAVLVAFLGRGLFLDPHEVPSPLIEKPAPEFKLPQLHAPEKIFSSAELKGKVWLLNVWGSWCVTCRQEHPLLNQIAKSGTIPVYGLNWKDKREDAIAWLQKFGDPYVASVSDIDGRIAIEYGVYAAPETFVIDKQGVIRYKQIGAMTPDNLRNDILPLLRKLQQ